MLFAHRPLLKDDQNLSNPAPHNPGEDVTNILKEFENGLESLRALYQQRQTLQNALKQRENDLHQRDQALASKDRALAERDQLLADRTREVESLTSQFDQKVREVEASQRAIAERESTLADKLSLLTAQQQELATRTEQLTRDAEAQAALAQEHEQSVQVANAEIDRIRDEIKAQRASIEARTAELDRLSNDLASRKSELDAARESLDQQSRAIAADREAVERDRARCEQIARESQAISARATDLESQVKELHTRLAAVEDKAQHESQAAATERSRAEEFEAQLANLWKAMEEEQEAAAKAADAAKRKLEAARADAEQRLQSELAKRTAESQRAAQDLARQHERATIEVERQWKQRLDESLNRERESAAAALHEAQQRLETLRAEYDARLTKELESQQRELTSASQQGIAQALGQATARLQSEWEARATAERAQLEADHNAQLQQIATEAKSRLAQIEAKYQQELAERRAQSDANSSAGDYAWQARLEDALAAERGHLARKLADAVALAAPPANSAGAAKEALDALKAAASTGDTDATITALESTVRHAFADRADMEGRLTETRGYLDEAADIIKSLESQLQQQRHAHRAAQQSGEAGVDPEFFITLENRRRRLKLMHALLRDRTDKMRQASEALRGRFEQCEAVLKQRAELSAAKEKIVEAERRIQRSSARTRASVVMLCAVSSMAVIGGLSWALARQVAPATFIATAELAADGRGRTLQPAELEEWNAYHDKVLQDPRFHQMAAERFQRLGMETLGTPTDVKRLIDTRIGVESMNPGQLSLHLKGQGSRETERTLNTFAAAFASHANAAQTARTDGGVTRVTQEARTGDDPIDNTRTYWALGMMGIATSVCFFVAASLWKKLAGAKTAFEQDHQIAQILDENRWGVQIDAAMEQKEVRGKKAA